MPSLAAICSGPRARFTLLALVAGLMLPLSGRLPAAVIEKADNPVPLNSTASWVGGNVPGSTDTLLLGGGLTAGNGTLLTGSGLAGGNLQVAGVRVEAGTASSPDLSLGTVNAGPPGTAGSLGLGAGGLDLSGATQNLTVGNLTVWLNSATGTASWNVSAGHTLTVSANLLGSGQGLTLDGSGRVVLGRAVTSLPGCVTDGTSTTVTVSSVTGLFVGEVVGAGGGLILPGTTVVSLDAGHQTVELSAVPAAAAVSCTLTFAPEMLYDGGVTLNAGTLALAGANALGGGVLTIRGGALDAILPLAVPNSQNWEGNFTVVGSAGLTLSAPGVVTLGASPVITVLAGTFTVAATIRDGAAGLGLTKAGANGTLALTGVNQYTGPTTISSGTLSIGLWNRTTQDNSLGRSAPAAASLVIDGGALRFIGATGGSGDHLFSIGGANATLDAGGTACFDFCNPGAIGFSGATAPAYNLTLTGSGTGGGSLEIALVDNGGAPLSLTKNGSGIWTLNRTVGPNTYSGGTYLNGGILAVSGLTPSGSGAGPLGTAGSPVVLNGGTLQAGTVRLDNVFSGPGGSIQAVGGDLEIGNLTIPAAVAFGGRLETGNRRVTVDSAGPATLGQIFLATGGSVQSSNGIMLPVTGNVTATGNATVCGPFQLSTAFTGNFANGEPVFQAATAQGPAGADWLSFAGPLTGGGALNGNILILGGYTPGANSPALIQVNGRTAFGAGSTLTLQLGGGGGRGLGYDSFNLNADGALDVTGATLRIISARGFAPSAGDAFTLFKLNPGGSFTGTFFTIDTSSASPGPGLAWDLASLYTAGEIEVVAAVPEPASLSVLLGALVLGLGCLRCRRDNRNKPAS